MHFPCTALVHAAGALNSAKATHSHIIPRDGVPYHDTACRSTATLHKMMLQSTTPTPPAGHTPHMQLSSVETHATTMMPCHPHNQSHTHTHTPAVEFRCTHTPLQAPPTHTHTQHKQTLLTLRGAVQVGPRVGWLPGPLVNVSCVHCSTATSQEYHPNRYIPPGPRAHEPDQSRRLHAATARGKSEWCLGVNAQHVRHAAAQHTTNGKQTPPNPCVSPPPIPSHPTSPSNAPAGVHNTGSDANVLCRQPAAGGCRLPARVADTSTPAECRSKSLAHTKTAPQRWYATTVKKSPKFSTDICRSGQGRSSGVLPGVQTTHSVHWVDRQLQNHNSAQSSLRVQ
jgi:hypothetical protein